MFEMNDELLAKLDVVEIPKSILEADGTNTYDICKFLVSNGFKSADLTFNSLTSRWVGRTKAIYLASDVSYLIKTDCYEMALSRDSKLITLFRAELDGTFACEVSYSDDPILQARVFDFYSHVLRDVQDILQDAKGVLYGY